MPTFHEVEIVYARPVAADPVQVSSSLDAYGILKTLFDSRKIDYKEMFYVVLLNRANYCLGYSMIGIGSTSGVVAPGTKY